MSKLTLIARPLERFDVDRDVNQGIEVTDRMDVARFGPLNTEVFGLAVDALGQEALVKDSEVGYYGNRLLVGG